MIQIVGRIPRKGYHLVKIRSAIVPQKLGRAATRRRGTEGRAGSPGPRGSEFRAGSRRDAVKIDIQYGGYAEKIRLRAWPVFGLNCSASTTVFLSGQKVLRESLEDRKELHCEGSTSGLAPSTPNWGLQANGLRDGRESGGTASQGQNSPPCADSQKP